jgi:hypothetical protein
LPLPEIETPLPILLPPSLQPVAMPTELSHRDYCRFSRNIRQTLVRIDVLGFSLVSRFVHERARINIPSRFECVTVDGVWIG